MIRVLAEVGVPLQIIRERGDKQESVTTLLGDAKEIDRGNVPCQLWIKMIVDQRMR
jgi:hypothetical protein